MAACFFSGAAWEILTSSGVWMSGKRPAGTADGFGKPGWPNEAGAAIRR
jgi:hypothetical protein